MKEKCIVISESHESCPDKNVQLKYRYVVIESLTSLFLQ